MSPSAHLNHVVRRLLEKQLANKTECVGFLVHTTSKLETKAGKVIPLRLATRSLSYCSRGEGRLPYKTKRFMATRCFTTSRLSFPFLLWRSIKKQKDGSTTICVPFASACILWWDRELLGAHGPRRARSSCKRLTLPIQSAYCATISLGVRHRPQLWQLLLKRLNAVTHVMKDAYEYMVMALKLGDFGCHGFCPCCTSWMSAHCVLGVPHVVPPTFIVFQAPIFPIKGEDY